jgi:hypothetical protein
MPCNMVNIDIGIITNHVGMVIINQFRPIILSSLKAHRTKKPPKKRLGDRIEFNSPMSMQLSIFNLNSSP